MVGFLDGLLGIRGEIGWNRTTFFNIDIDTSTLVDLSLPTLEDQQRDNAGRCAEITQHIRGVEPEEVTVSVGGEIGEVGHKNSTVEELRAFMQDYDVPSVFGESAWANGTHRRNGLYIGAGPAINTGFPDGLDVADAKARTIDWHEREGFGRKNLLKMQAELNQFLKYLQYQRKYSDHTIESYKTDLLQFLKYFNDSNKNQLILTLFSLEVIYSFINIPYICLLILLASVFLLFLRILQ